MSKAKKTETPLMQQHNQIKAKYPDAILLFRVGDFYETFGEDAIVTSKILGIVLTKRANGSASHIELAGFPHHSLDSYLHKIVKAGHRVAICDQLEDPKMTKTIVKRGVTEVVSPGVTVNDKLLENKSNNFLAAVHFDSKVLGLALVDISTGEFLMAEGSKDYVDKLIQTFNPSEILIAKKDKNEAEKYWKEKFYLYAMNDWFFENQFAVESFTNHFQTKNLKGFGVDDMEFAITAGGAILQYLKDNELPKVSHINSIQRIVNDEFLWMDKFTIKNLDLLTSANDEEHSLLYILDNTHTPMGARMMHRWLCFPLTNIHKINERLDAVDFLIQNSELRNSWTQHFKAIGDPERIVARIPLKKINPREVLQLAKALEQCSIIKNKILSETGNDYLQRIADKINPCEKIKNTILKTINEEAPNALNKGTVIQNGINAELDDYRNIQKNGKEYLLNIQKNETEKSGITSLKIGFNNVFGYYLEVTNTHKDKVPSDWIRKQTLSNAERYITPELKEYEEKILKAEEKIIQLEIEIYSQLVDSLQEYIEAIQINAHAIATLDCLSSFAFNALEYNYSKPKMHDENYIKLTQSRHPIIEYYLPPGENYIANNIELNNDEQQIIILTGPNMSGKSALLRQTALNVLMAHIGSFIPSEYGEIALTDKIFTRVGASDNMSSGESTFMVEMNETAGIINNISPRSLILLDEIGRGTSTYDGISIAWAIVEFLHNATEKPKTLFATHYHELNELENRMDRIFNYHISHAEVGKNIVFTRMLTRGGSNHSFGIHVAKMAGMPSTLIKRATEVLKTLEELREKNKDSSDAVKHIPQQASVQLSFFDSLSDDLTRIKEILQNTDINILTPVEALMRLNEMKKILQLKND